MSLIKQLEESLAKARARVSDLSSQVEALLKEGKLLDGDEITPLMGQREEAFTELDSVSAAIDQEIRQVEAEKSVSERLAGYESSGFVAPRDAQVADRERIDGIATGSLRAFAIANPILVSDGYHQAISEYLHRSMKANRELPLEPFLAEHAGLDGAAIARLMELVTDELGGYTVPVDVQDSILRNLGTFSVMRNLTPPMPTTSNVVEWTIVKRASGARKGIYTGTFVGAMVSDLPSTTEGEASLEFTQIQIPIEKARVLGWVAEDWVADSSADVMGLLRDEGALNLAILQDQQMLTGTGANNELLGILNHPQADTPALAEEIDVTVMDSGPTANEISNSTTDRGSEEELLALIDSVPGQYRVGPGVAFIGHSKTRTKIRGLVTPGGDFLYRFELGAEITAAGRAGSVEGIPFHISDHMAQGGTDTNKVLLFGNMRHYRSFERQSLSVRVSMEQKFSEEQVGLRINTRFGGHVTNPEAFGIGRV